MKKIFIFASVFLIATFSHASDENQEHCDIEKFNLSIYKKSDYKFISKACSKNEQTSVENFLVSKNQDNIFVNKKFEQGGYEPTILEAVSVYNKNKTKPPILITLHSQYNCCYPRPEGKNYQVDLYQIQNNKGKLKLKSYTYVLGDYADGFEGQTDVREKSIFKFKDIASIKKWLDKNYK